MTTLLISDRGDASYLSWQAENALQRLGAGLRGWSLDAELARGVSPDSSLPLSLRAQRLISPRTRRKLARGIRQVVREAEHPRCCRYSAVSICRREVMAARAELEAVAERLDGPDPVDVMGVAQLRLLFGDGLSPLYNQSRAGTLALVLEEASEALTPSLSPV